jgi:altronate dehydratase
MIPKMGDKIFRLILEIAAGKKTISEFLDSGDIEFVP